MTWLEGREGRVHPRQVAAQAMVLHREEGEEGSTFTASMTWVQKFLRRNGLQDSDLISYNVKAGEEQERPFSCAQCAKRLASASSLKEHMTIHTGERPHVCSYCAKDFRGRKELEYHERTHTGDKPYSCNICGKTCVDASNMKKHEKAHTAEELQDAYGEEGDRRVKFYSKIL